MTSRNSFFKLLKEDLHRRLWTLILASLVFFSTFVVAFTMVIQNYVSRYSGSNYGLSEAEFVSRISERLCKEFYSFYPWFMVVAVVGAIICGMNGFAYLHSRKQMDFYHSLPIKRETIFFVRLVNGVLIYAVPYLVGLLFTYLVCILYGVMTWDILGCSLFCFLFYLMGYVIMYLGTILAMMLTGKLVIGFFGLCVINLYAPAVYALGWSLKETFFITSYISNMDLEKAVKSTRFLSPIAYYCSLVMETNELKDLSGFWSEVIFFLLFAAVLVALNLWLYKKRASEKADTAMAFLVTEPIIRILISVPVGALAGLLFYFIQYETGGEYSLVWLIFGGFFGAFLCHGIMEALYKGDIRKCLSHKVQMAVTMALAAVIPLVFLFDVFGYDSYLPKKTEIKSMAISSSELRFGGSFYDENGWVSATDYVLDNMQITEIDAVYELAEILAADVSEHRAERFFGYSGSYYPTRADSYYAGGAEKMNYTNFIIRYTLNNGSEVIREYEYNYYAVMDLLERIYNDNNYKSAVHPVFSLLKPNIQLEELSLIVPACGTKSNLSNSRELLEAYAEDILDLSFDDLRNSGAVGELMVSFQLKQDSMYGDVVNLLLYPGMHRTLALLKAQGCEVQGIQQSDEIQSISISYGGSIDELKRILGMEVDEEEVQNYYEEMGIAYEDYELYYEKYGSYPQTVATKEAYQDLQIEFTALEEIDEIKKNLVCRQYGSEFGPFPELENFLYVIVYFQREIDDNTVFPWDEQVVAWSENYRFLEDSIPQFVMERLFEELGAED